MTNSRTSTYVIAAIGLLAITLGLFAIAWPFNGADFDDWWDLRISESRVWHHEDTNRPFNTGGLAIAQYLMPDRMARLLYMHMVFLWGISLGIFHIIFRLYKQRMAWVAFSAAAAYVAYIPYALDQVRTQHVAVYPWVILLATISAAMLIEFLMREDRARFAFLAGSAIFGYIAIRAFEALIAPVVCLPFLILIFDPRLNRERLLGLAGWALVVGVATMQFVVPYMRGDEQSSYQTDLQAADQSILELIDNTVEFFDTGFPLEDKILATEFNLNAPALLTTLVFLAGGTLLWQTSPEDRRLPSPLALILMFGAGIALAGLGGAAAIFADLHLLPRSHLPAVPGQSLAVTALILGIVALGERLLRARVSILLLVAGAMFMFTANQWYFQAQIRADAHGLDMTVNNDLWRDMKNLIPDTEPDTLILYTCAEPTQPHEFIRSSSLGASLLFYDQDRTQVAFWRFDIALVIEQPDLIPTEDGIVYDAIRYTDVVTFEEKTYGYDEVIVVTCAPTGLQILDTFPAELAPPHARTDLYNPYARIREAFIAPAGMLNR